MEISRWSSEARANTTGSCPKKNAPRRVRRRCRVSPFPPHPPGRISISCEDPVVFATLDHRLISVTPPASKSAGRQLRVHPNRHAARIGWSMRRRAYMRHALRSSDSKSGISSRICAASRPEAKRSRTSLTRIRIPRTQGRPPHCFGLTVMRSSKVAIRDE